MNYNRQYLEARRRGPNFYGNGNAFQHFQHQFQQEQNYGNEYYDQGNPYGNYYNPPAQYYANDGYDRAHHAPLPSARPYHVPNKRKAPSLPENRNELVSIGLQPPKKPVPAHNGMKEASYAKQKKIIPREIADIPLPNDAIVPSPILPNRQLKGAITSTPFSSIIVIDDADVSMNSSGIGTLEGSDLSKSSSCDSKTGFKFSITSTPIQLRSIKTNNQIKSKTTPSKNCKPKRRTKPKTKTNLQQQLTTSLYDDVIILDEVGSSSVSGKNSPESGECSPESGLDHPEQIIDLTSINEVDDNSQSMAGLSLVCNANNTEREDLNDVTFEVELLSNMLEARESFYEQQHQQPLPVNNNSPVAPLNVHNLYIIVDTNIFIDRMQTIINIMHITYEDNSEPVIYVPWMVVQELDYFKDGYSVSTKYPISSEIQFRSRKAVKFINECLVARKTNFRGQPVQRAAENRLKGHTPDDSILECCMQLFGEGYEVMLLSHDINLRNKAMINNVRAFSPNDIMKELKKKPPKMAVNFVEEISRKLGAICTVILPAEMKSFYGESTYARKSFKSQPWRFRDCVRYLRDHFRPVFHTRVPKQCRKVVDDLHEVMVDNEAIVNEVKYEELCLSLLIYLQTGLPQWQPKIEDAIEELKRLEKKYVR